MQQLLQQLVNGLSLGSIFALVALGYTMVYGIIKLINFAHGDIYMIGAYVGYMTITSLKVGLIPALLIAMVVCGLLGVLIEKVAYKPLRNASRITSLITAIGVSMFLEYGMMYVMGASVRTFPEVIDNKIFTIGGVNISTIQILIFVTTIVLMVLLQFIVHKTKIGKAMRAVSVDPDAAQLMGINVDSTISYTFLIGSALAGAAGVLVGIYYNSISPLMGFTPGLKAFIAAVFGGIGSIPGALIGGVSIGVIETLVSGYASSLLKDAVVYIVLIIILVFKPTGLLGKNVKEKV
ncbi:MAG: branched-chain amino acid ABC transporter permease [Erysipelotrichaceae bacterium]